MRIFITLPKDCKATLTQSEGENSVSVLAVETDKKEINIPVIIQGNFEAREYIAQAKDIKEEIKFHVG